MIRRTVTPPVLIFDGDCAFCSSAVRFLQRAIDRRSRYAVQPYQFIDLVPFDLTDEQTSEALRFVAADGTVHSGAMAVSHALRRSAPGWRPAGWVLAAPGIRWVADRAYRWIAAHRHQLPGGTAACKLPQPPAVTD